MKITLTSRIDITGAPEPLVRKIRDTFTIENPRWIDNDRMSRWNGETDHWLTFYENHPGGLTIPRGAMGLILFFCKEMGIRYQIIDQRRTLPEVDFTFTGILKGYQQQATTDILSRDFGVLQAPTGSGKTVMALSIICRTPAAYLDHRSQQRNSWTSGSNVSSNSWASHGRRSGSSETARRQIGEQITVGIINSIYPIAEEIQESLRPSRR